MSKKSISFDWTDSNGTQWNLSLFQEKNRVLRVAHSYVDSKKGQTIEDMKVDRGYMNNMSIELFSKALILEGAKVRENNGVNLE